MSEVVSEVVSDACAARPAEAVSEVVDVFWARTADAAAPLTALLGPDDHARHDALRRPADRQRFLVGSALSRVVLGRRLGVAPGELQIRRDCPGCERRHGRPRLSGTGAPSFSVSHCEDVVAVAVGPSVGVGLDVERERPFPALPGAPDLRTWVGKEAALKATGHGLSVPMAELELPGGTGAVRRRAGADSPPDFPPVAVASALAPAGYLAAVAVLATTAPSVHHHDGSAMLTGLSRQHQGVPV